MARLIDSDPVDVRAQIDHGQLLINSAPFAKLGNLLGQTSKSKVFAGSTLAGAPIESHLSVAIKTFNPESRLHRDLYRHQLLQEHRLLKELFGHPHILELIGTCLEESGIPTLITGYAGVTLDKIVSERASKGVWGIEHTESIEIASATHAALEAVHAKGVTIGDLKMSNIFIRTHDLGSKITSSQVRIGDIVNLGGVHTHGNNVFYDRWDNPQQKDDYLAIERVLFLAKNPKANLAQVKAVFAI